MKSALPLILLFTVPLISGCEVFSSKTEAEESTIIIRSGTSFGECMGYCRTELHLNASSVVFLEKGWRSTMYPDKRQERTMSRAQWDQLIALIDFSVLAQMQDVYGCPDCADGGAEWIEIEQGDQYKKVTFEYGDTLNPIAQLTQEVRRIRNQFRPAD